MKKKYLCFGLWSKSSSDADTFRDGCVVSQIVLAGFTDLAGNREIGPLEVLQIDVNDGIVKRSDVGFLDRLYDFWNSHALYVYVGTAVQAYVTVWLYRNGLIEFRGKRERKTQHILTLDLITRISLFEHRPRSMALAAPSCPLDGDAAGAGSGSRTCADCCGVWPKATEQAEITRTVDDKRNDLIVAIVVPSIFPDVECTVFPAGRKRTFNQVGVTQQDEWPLRASGALCRCLAMSDAEDSAWSSHSFAALHNHEPC